VKILILLRYVRDDAKEDAVVKRISNLLYLITITSANPTF
jgi:hypothetical protein